MRIRVPYRKKLKPTLTSMWLIIWPFPTVMLLFHKTFTMVPENTI